MRYALGHSFLKYIVNNKGFQIIFYVFKSLNSMAHGDGKTNVNVLTRFAFA